MNGMGHWLAGGALVMGALTAVPRAEVIPKLQEASSTTDPKVEELPDGAERSEWLLIKKRHPNADLPTWVLKRGWGPPAGCMGPFGPQHCFIRICPENGALTLDWAQASRINDPFRPRHEGIGPRVLPPEVRQAPRLTPEQAWSRVIQAVRLLGAEVPAGYSQPGRSVLRILEGGQRLRLVYQFAPSCTTRLVSTDVLTGEVGGIELSYIGVQFFDPDDPLRVFLRCPWVRTYPPLDTPRKKPLGWGKQIRMEVRAVRFRKLLKILYADTGLRYTVDPDIPDASLTVSLQNLSLREALGVVREAMRERVPGLTVGAEGASWRLAGPPGQS